MISNKDDLYYLSDWRLRDNKVGALSNIYHFNDIFISAYLRQKNGQFRQQRGLVCSKSLYWLQTAWNIWEQSSIFRDDPVTTKVWLHPVPAGPPGDGYEAEWVTPEVRDSHKDTVIGGHAQPWLRSEPVWSGWRSSTRPWREAVCVEDTASPGQSVPPTPADLPGDQHDHHHCGT